MRIAGFIIMAALLSVTSLSASNALADDHKKIRPNSSPSKKQGQVVITAVGDLIFTRKISQLKTPEHSDLYAILQESDITVGNLEMSLNSSPDDGIYNFVKNKEFVWEIAGLGFNMLGLANNHQLDFGRAGLEECMSILKSARISYAGGGRDLKESLTPTYHRIDGLTVAFLSFYSEEFKSLARPDTDKPSIATIRAPKVWLEKSDGTNEKALAPLEKDARAMEDAIAIARRYADVVMVAIHVHWLDHASIYGVPDSVPPNQALIFRKAVSAGADIVLGTGPHVLRGIEIYNGKIIFYSLGNFIYQYKKDKIPPVIYKRDPQKDKDEEFESIVARLIFNQKKLTEVRLIPVKLEGGGENYGAPHLSNEKSSKVILQRLAELSSEYGTEIVIDKTHGIVKLK